MIRFILKRILYSIPTLFALLLIVFVIMKKVPGGPFDSELALPKAMVESLQNQYHFNEPVLKQFMYYIENVIKGELGPSYSYFGNRTVNEIIAESFPISIKLGLLSLLFATTFGVLFGIWSAYYRGSWFDFATLLIALAGISLPSYLVASILILVFSVWLKILPVALIDGFSSYILPIIVLGLRPLALITRITRTSMIEALQSDYIRTARAKGLSRSVVLYKHALKNSLIPVITMFGPLTAALISGSFVVEVIFVIPGLGKYFISAVLDRDYSMIMGLSLVYGTLIIAANLIVDALYSAIDPRMRIQ